MPRTLILLALAAAGSWILVAQEKKAEPKPPAASEFKIPPEDSKRVNPVKLTETSIADGKRLYVTQCLMCHGEGGNAKGDLVEPMELKLRDWREPAALKEFTDGDLFYIIEKGKGKMPDQLGRMKENQIWNMVNYARSLAKKESPSEPKKP